MVGLGNEFRVAAVPRVASAGVDAWVRVRFVFPALLERVPEGLRGLAKFASLLDLGGLGCPRQRRFSGFPALEPGSNLRGPCVGAC